MNAASLVADQPQLELERDLVPGALHVGGGYPGWSPRMSYMGCVLEECSIPSSPRSGLPFTTSAALFPFRGHTYMTSTLGGGAGGPQKADKSTEVA